MQKRSFRISEGSFLKYVDFTNSRLLEVTKEECNHSSDLHITKRTSVSDALVVLFIMTALNI